MHRSEQQIADAAPDRGELSVDSGAEIPGDVCIAEGIDLSQSVHGIFSFSVLFYTKEEICYLSKPA